MAVSSFKYLGRVLSESDNNWPAVICNLRIARNKWAHILWVLGQEGADSQTSVMLYTAVVQVVLLYRSESWVMSLRICKALGGFHRQIIQQLTGRMPYWGGGGKWFYPPPGEAMAEAGLQDIETYVARHQNTGAQYISSRPIMDLFLAAGSCPGARFSKRWWYQEDLDLEGIWEAAREAEAERY